MSRRNKYFQEEPGFGPEMDLVISLFAISIIVIAIGTGIYNAIFSDLNQQISKLLEENRLLNSDLQSQVDIQQIIDQLREQSVSLSEQTQQFEKSQISVSALNHSEKLSTESINNLTARITKLQDTMQLYLNDESQTNSSQRQQLSDLLLILDGLLQRLDGLIKLLPSLEELAKLKSENQKMKAILAMKDTREELFSTIDDENVTYFENNHIELSQALKKELMDVIDVIKEKMDSGEANHVVVEGYASYTPPKNRNKGEYANMKFSMDRINNVSSFLLQQGLAVDCISAIWYGRGKLDSFAQLKKLNPNITLAQYDHWTSSPYRSDLAGARKVKVTESDRKGRVTVALINETDAEGRRIVKQCIQ